MGSSGRLLLHHQHRMTNLCSKLGKTIESALQSFGHLSISSSICPEADFLRRGTDGPFFIEAPMHALVQCMRRTTQQSSLKKKRADSNACMTKQIMHAITQKKSGSLCLQRPAAPAVAAAAASVRPSSSSDSACSRLGTAKFCTTQTACCPHDLSRADNSTASQRFGSFSCGMLVTHSASQAVLVAANIAVLHNIAGAVQS